MGRKAKGPLSGTLAACLSLQGISAVVQRATQSDQAFAALNLEQRSIIGWLGHELACHIAAAGNDPVRRNVVRMSRAAVLLRYGRFFEVNDLTHQVYEKGAPRRCYQNARTLVYRHGALYCEGVSCSGSIPVLIHHGWATEPGEPQKPYPDKLPLAFEATVESGWFSAYFGIAFSARFSRELLLQGGKYRYVKSLAVLDQYGLSKHRIPFVDWIADKQDSKIQSAMAWNAGRSCFWSDDLENLFLGNLPLESLTQNHDLQT